MTAKKTPKAITILKIVDHIIETYSPHRGPCLLMWRETMNSFNLKQSENFPAWTRDDKSVHEHWKRYGPGVVAELKHRYRMTIVKVNGRARKYLKHGGTPDRDDRCRIDAYYKSCLPSAANMVLGFVAFPRDTQLDHPLIIASLDQRGKTSATGLENSVVAIDAANDLGNLSGQARQEIHGHVASIVRRAIEERHPLFPRAVEENSPATPRAIEE